MKYLWLVVALFLAACSSSGAVPPGDELGADGGWVFDGGGDAPEAPSEDVSQPGPETLALDVDPKDVATADLAPDGTPPPDTLAPDTVQPEACQTDQDCKPLDDLDRCNGTLRCGQVSQVCEPNPATVIRCATDADTACRVNTCNPATGGCALLPRNDGGTCDDGDGCSSNDRCSLGACVGLPCSAFDLECYQDACVACAPKCAGRACGDDGCGGTCGTCNPGETCTAGQCLCVPNCQGRLCGDDGCGGSCGPCLGTLTCVSGQCRGCGDGFCDPSEKCSCQQDCANCGGASINWVKVAGGTFMMGCAPSDNTCLLDQKPRHQVTISDFLVMDTLLTYAQCSSFQLFPQATCRYMDPQGTLGASINDVATALTWQQAVQVCELLGGRLPTEAEFEFMVRAGGNARFFCGEQESCLGSLVCTSGLSTCQRVRQRAANPWGLYDLNGVMAQHVQDYYSSSYYGPDPVTDPQGPATGVFRGGRGVGWIQSAACSTYCYYYTASMRYYSPPDFGPAQGGPRGVRCVRELP